MGGAERICRNIVLQEGNHCGIVGLAFLSGCDHRIFNREWLEQLENYFSHRTRLPKARSQGLVLWLSVVIQDPALFVFLLFYHFHVAGCLMLQK